MSFDAPIATEDPTEAERDAAYYRDVLHGLIGRADALAKEAAADPALAVAERIQAHEHAARTIRRCIVLARQVAANPAPISRAKRAVARKQIIRAVDEAIERRVGDPDAAAELRGELVERLDAPDFDDDITQRPIADIIRDIRHDLGLAAPTAPRRTPDALRTIAAIADAPPGAAVTVARAMTAIRDG